MLAIDPSKQSWPLPILQKGGMTFTADCAGNKLEKAMPNIDIQQGSMCWRSPGGIRSQRLTRRRLYDPV
eukprot:3381603-Amphidinium_carterae.1